MSISKGIFLIIGILGISGFMTGLAMAWMIYVSPLFRKDHLVKISKIMTWTILAMFLVHMIAEMLRIIVLMIAG